MSDAITRCLAAAGHVAAPFLLDTFVKATVLVVAAYLATSLIRPASAAVRHRIWGTTFVCLLLLPVLSALLPDWRLPIVPRLKNARPVVSVPASQLRPVASKSLVADPPATDQPFQDSLPGTDAPAPSPSDSSSARAGLESPGFPEPTEQPGTPSAAHSAIILQSGWKISGQSSFFVIWLVGLATALVPIAVGLARNRALGLSAEPVFDSERYRSFAELRGSLGIRRTVRLLETRNSLVPMTWGILRPIVLVPRAWREWSLERQRIVLLHELAHVERWDTAFQVLSRLICAVYWCHPLVWFSLRRLRAERELACDDRVLMAGESATDYAGHLLEIARDYRALPMMAAVAMARPTGLERRIRALLDQARSRLPISPAAGRMVLVFAAILLVAVATVGEERTTAAKTTAANDKQTDQRPEGNAAAAPTDESADGPSEDSAQDADAGQPFELLDAFDGKLALDWEVLRPNPTNVSLEKTPGRLTITSQHGGLHQGGGNNLHMIANPAVGGGDFVVTTCLEQFHPEEPFQQAGPHIYDDDDNYLKAIIARSERNVLIGSAWEARGEFGGRDQIAEDIEWKRLWLRIIKRGRAYESSYSLDGEKYTVIAERVWGDGSPEKIGLAVMNENGTRAPLDAAFDFFEVRSLSDEEKNDPVYIERRKLQGTWQVVSSRLGGNPMEDSLWSRFEFHGIEATFSEEGASFTSKYALHLEKEPKGLELTGVGRERFGHTLAFEADRNLMNAVYSIEQDRLVICMDPRPGSPAPTELETKEGDGRLLIELRRMSEVEIAAIARNELPAKEYVNRLDTNDDEHLSMEEFTADWPTPEAVKQGTEVFQIIDRDGDDKMTVDELKSKPMRAAYLLIDLNADGVLTFREFSLGPIKSASAARTRRVFTSTDRDGNQTVSYEEFHDRPREAWFHSIDLNSDGEMSHEEFARDNPRLVQNGSHREAFGAIDRNGDGKVQMGEYCQRVWHPQTAFRGLDRDGDGALVLREFVPRGGDRNDVQKATDVFAIIDRDRDGKLTQEEYTTRPREAIFREYDDEGDGGLDLNEFHSADMKGASAVRVQRAFALVDKNGDGQVSFEEFYSRSNEAWFRRMDVDEDGRMSLAEYGEGNPALVQSGRIHSVFAAIDRNGDGGVSLDEFVKKPQEALFGTQDADGDERLTFQEFSLWRHTPQQVAAAKQEFAQKDTDSDDMLSFKEYAYRSEDADFWKADKNADNWLNRDEFEVSQIGTTAGDQVAAFKSLDLNRDDNISLSEFQNRPDSD